MRMQDRYLFRGKRIDNGEWVIGNRIDDGVTGQVFIHTVGNSVNESDKVGEEGCLQFVAFEVAPATICQCTGLKDKNGNLTFKNFRLLIATLHCTQCRTTPHHIINSVGTLKFCFKRALNIYICHNYS